jgi:hypothetical protein
MDNGERLAQAVLAAAGLSFWSFELSDLSFDAQELVVRIRGKRGGEAWIRLPFSRSWEEQHWLHAEPEDEEDWAVQLLNWIDEEVRTLGLGSSRQRQMEGNRSFVLPEIYGWRRSNGAVHEQLVK